jgi:DNA-directed RNA polymerase subunit N (RpoN/RPB10)
MENRFEEIVIDLPNIRCTTCGKVIGHLHGRLCLLREKNYSNEEIFEELGLARPCCRNSMIYPPKYSIVSSIEENKQAERKDASKEEEVSIGTEKSIALKGRLNKIKEQTKKPSLCYYAI